MVEEERSNISVNISITFFSRLRHYFTGVLPKKYLISVYGHTVNSGTTLVHETMLKPYK